MTIPLYLEPVTGIMGATEAPDGCEVCAELEALLQTPRRRRGGGGRHPRRRSRAYRVRFLADSYPTPRKGPEPRSPLAKSWPSLRIGVEDAHRYFNGADQNVGVLLGAPSGGLVDVDLDCAEAVTAASFFLPRYACFGVVRALP